MPELFGIGTQQNMKFILDSVNSQGLPSYEDVTGMGGEDEGKRASSGSNTSKFQLSNEKQAYFSSLKILSNFDIFLNKSSGIK